MRVLLVVDMQEGFVSNAGYRRLAEDINQLVSKQDYDKYIFTKFINDKSKNSMYIDKLNWTKLQSEKEQAFSVNIPVNSIVMEKYGYGLKSEDLAVIGALGVKEIDVCGVKSEACVYAISLQLWDMGICPNILSKYVLGDVDMSLVYEKQFGKIVK